MVVSYFVEDRIYFTISLLSIVLFSDPDTVGSGIKKNLVKFHSHLFFLTTNESCVFFYKTFVKTRTHYITVVCAVSWVCEVML